VTPKVRGHRRGRRQDPSASSAGRNRQVPAGTANPVIARTTPGLAVTDRGCIEVDLETPKAARSFGALTTYWRTYSRRRPDQVTENVISVSVWFPPFSIAWTSSLYSCPAMKNSDGRVMLVFEGPSSTSRPSPRGDVSSDTMAR
jgi:hypothetical protein